MTKEDRDEREIYRVVVDPSADKDYPRGYFLGGEFTVSDIFCNSKNNTVRSTWEIGTVFMEKKTRRKFIVAYDLFWQKYLVPHGIEPRRSGRFREARR